MEKIKHIMLLLLLSGWATYGFSQPINSTVQVNPGQCVTNPILNNAITDSVVLIAPPMHGTFQYDSINYTYCADSNFTGIDNAILIACYHQSFFTYCDTVYITFDVRYQPACNISVSLAVDSGVCSGGNRNFTPIVTGANGAYSWAWSNGSSDSSICELSPGQGVCITVTDATSCSATACSNSANCQLSVVIVPDTCGGSPALTAIVTGGTGQYNYYWSNGVNGATYCNAAAHTTYCISVFDNFGCGGSACYNNPRTGNCGFSYTPGGTPIQPATVFNAYYDSSYTVSSIYWDFNDGIQHIDTGLSVTHYYTQCSYYDVKMFIYYTNGDSCTYDAYLMGGCDSINNTFNCQARFYAYIDSNNTFQFYDNSVYSPTSWTWDFGDNTTSTQQNPSHTYIIPGTFNVCLTITGANGCSNTYCQTVSNVPTQDVEAYLFHGSTVTPGYPVYVNLQYYNVGTILMAGNVQYRYPAGTSFNYSSPAPDAIDSVNRLLTFNYSNLVPGSSGYIFVDLDASAGIALASLTYDTMWLNPIAGDVTPFNNISTITDSVVGSWDPNDKSVSPKGFGENGVIPPSTQELSYMIHFQNTGNGPAQKVVVRDAISANLDLSSITVTKASHEYNVQIIGNELVVTFDNINLPDSGSSYNASQGYIAVHAMLKPGLQPGAQIFNTANIYFDFNSPVVTNTVVNTIAGVTGIETVGKLEFAMIPNPANDQVFIRGEFDKNTEYQFIDQLGQVISRGELTGYNNRLNVSTLSSGIYLVKVQSGEKTGTQRLIITR